LNTSERCHIYRIVKDSLHMNDIHNDKHNSTFEILQQLYTRYLHPPPPTPNYVMKAGLDTPNIQKIFVYGVY
jgi:hypothetical protein